MLHHAAGRAAVPCRALTSGQGQSCLGDGSCRLSMSPFLEPPWVVSLRVV